jgi:predicted metalloprotease with PDZ domain
MIEGPTPNLRVLRHRAGVRIQATWRVIHNWPDAPAGLQNDPYRPVIQPDYFQVLGPAAMIVPQVGETTPARFGMRGFPRAWSLASDLERPGLTQKKLYYSVFVGGDYRMLRGARDPNVRLAIRGAWTFRDEDLLRDVEKILEGQRRFWGDPSTPYFVAVTPLPEDIPQHFNYGGSNLGDAYAFFATPNVELKMLTHSLAHESLHAWIPFELGFISEVDEAASYWFSEGFTDFFAPRILVRDRIWGAREFAGDLNAMLRAYAASPERTAPNARIVEARTSDPKVEQLPYQRGRLFATLIDARLRTRGRDLDEVMLEMRRRAPTAGMYAPALFAAVMADMGLPVDEDIRTYVERGEPIPLPEDSFAPCGTLVTRGVRQELVLDPSLDGARREACLRVLGGA